ncbi:hypothetical protein QVD17_01412 [Tagetes erecta]|uniref:Uncharacterized protein n=1 Tax=Tagetes erecta TaxID=13708 RepID=A0AAD8P8B5_TARER|nr:hypothetical protein QVD17_01412 [Tagetes erecta]
MCSEDKESEAVAGEMIMNVLVLDLGAVVVVRAENVNSAARKITTTSRKQGDWKQRIRVTIIFSLFLSINKFLRFNSLSFSQLH